jgi:hypothetical protein
MARTAAGQVSARKTSLARCRTVIISAALIAALGQFADMRQASAQYNPMGPPQQAPYPTYAPFPPALSPPGQVLAPPVTQRVAPANTQRRLVRPRRYRHEFVERRRTVAARALKSVPRNERNVRRAESRRKPVENRREVAEKNGYKRVSDLVNFPKFFPGLGIIYVKPDTLPTGPFLCFDRQDHLVATVYMIPVKDIDDHKTIDAAGVDGPVDHVSFYFNPGHPGVDMPHYHFVIWHVSKKDEARVAQ